MITALLHACLMVDVYIKMGIVIKTACKASRLCRMWNTARSKVQHSPLSAFSHTIAMLSDIRFSYWVKGEELSKSRSPWMTSDEFCRAWIFSAHDMNSSLFCDLASFPPTHQTFSQHCVSSLSVVEQKRESHPAEHPQSHGGWRQGARQTEGGPAFTRCSERSADPAEWGSGRRGRKAGAGGEREGGGGQ